MIRHDPGHQGFSAQVNTNRMLLQICHMDDTSRHSSCATRNEQSISGCKACYTFC